MIGLPNEDVKAPVLSGTVGSAGNGDVRLLMHLLSFQRLYN
jgi:hypothetical protein